VSRGVWALLIAGVVVFRHHFVRYFKIKVAEECKKILVFVIMARNYFIVSVRRLS
jgi:hypothetical protein